MASQYTPDNWVVIKITGDDPTIAFSLGGVVDIQLEIAGG